MPNANVVSAESPDQLRRKRNLRLRIVAVLFILPFLGWVIADGEWLFTLVIACVLSLAALEYGQLFRLHGLRPSIPLLIIGVSSLAVGRFLFGFEHMPFMLALLCLLTQIWHLVDYERGATRSATDFALTLAGILFLGWIGSYLISLRRIPDGEWWVLIVLPCVWLADGFAFVAGRVSGNHQLTRRLSPSKSWEGYLAGVLASTIGGASLIFLWRIGAGPDSTLSVSSGLVVGLMIGLLVPLGDLGISMIKRELQVKDTSELIPGHGGMLDRLDTWLWAGVLGYYLVTWIST
jgi:phosphatidate cytidylyltransferase